MNPAGSFFRFLLGFLTFITLSFAITFAVSTYTLQEDEAQQTAAAFEALVGE
jgi:hypothetical protein